MAAALQSKAFLAGARLARSMQPQARRATINVTTRAAFTLPPLPYPIVSGLAARIEKGCHGVHPVKCAYGSTLLASTGLHGLPRAG
jgi:hypothetical protein